MSTNTEEVNPQTVPVLYDTLVKLGYHTAAKSLLKDSQRNKDDLVKGLNPNICIQDWLNTLANDKVGGKKRNLSEMQKDELKKKKVKKILKMDQMKMTKKTK